VTPSPGGDGSVHVAFVTQVDLSGMSGQHLYSRSVATALADHEAVDLTVVCPSPAGGTVPPLDRRDVDVKLLPAKSPGSVRWHARVQFATARALAGTHRHRSLDGIVTPLKTSNLVPPLVAGLTGVPMALLVEADLVTDVRERQPVPGPAALASGIAFLNAVGSTHVFAVDETAAERIRRLPGVASTDVTVCSHGVDHELFRPTDRESARDDVGIGDDDPDLVVGFVGSFKPYHELEVLVRAVARLAADGVDVRLLLVGTGPAESAVRDLVAGLALRERTTFAGFVEHGSVPTYVVACDVLYGVIDPDHVGHPMKIYEYLACGRPVVAYDDPELSFVSRNDLGALVQSVSPETVAQTLKRFVGRSQADRAATESRARSYVLNHQTWDSFARDIVVALRV